MELEQEFLFGNFPGFQLPPPAEHSTGDADTEGAESPPRSFFPPLSLSLIEASSRRATRRG